MTPTPEKGLPVAADQAPGNESIEKRPHKFLWNFAFQLLNLFWIAPVAAVLTLNFRGFVVGAGLGCGIHGCDVNPYSTNQIQQIDDEDRNITGALQLAAKALEIWFGVVVGSMVYDLTAYLATTGEGLPLFYLGTPLNLSPSMFIDRSFWLSTTNPPATAGQHDPRKWVLRLFVLFVAIILLITTLMGPATAILLLPTLGWKTVAAGQQPQAFSRLASADPPSSSSSSESLLEQCSSAELAIGGYSCSPSGPTLDLLFQNRALNYYRNPAGLIYGDVSYTFNQTDYGATIYSPTDQAMSDMYHDYGAWIDSSYSTYEEASFQDETLSRSDYNLMRNSQQTQRLRTNPAFFTLSTCYNNATSIVEAGNDKVVRCYDIPNTDSEWGLYWALPPNSSTLFATRCIREGSGWPSGSNNQSEFSVATGNSSSPTLRVNVYSSDRAVFLNTSTHTCVGNNTSRTTTCDWDALFAEDPDPLLRNVSVNAQITEYSVSDSITAYCFTSTYLRFPTYSLDTSPTTNPQSLVIMLDPELSSSGIKADPILVHPDWTLVAWGVDTNGTVSSPRTAASELASTYQSSNETAASLNGLQNLVAAQRQYYISYSTTDNLSSSNNTTNPILDVKTSVYVWSYGLGSHTAKFGAVVAIFGCVLVLVKFLVGLAVPADHRSFLNLFVGALTQAPPQAIVDMANKPEKDVAKRRFRMEDGKWPEFLF